MSAAFACSLATGGGTAPAEAVADVLAPHPASNGVRPVVEVLPQRVQRRLALDPNADPQTPLGTLRSRHFPIWAQELDWAFPPETCGTSWELDSIAEPARNVDIALYGNVASMAALAVMRYEHLVSRALAHPTVLAQVCVAVGSLDPARAEALKQLKAAITEGAVRSTASFPLEVTLVAVSPSAALAVACLSADEDAASTQRGAPLGHRSGARLRAYKLEVSRGLEDRVDDIAYRVSRIVERAVDDCSASAEWTREWQHRVANWIDDGRLWMPATRTLAVEDLCAVSLSGVSVECPWDWRQ